MNNRIIATVIGLGLIAVLVLVVFMTGGNKQKGKAGQIKGNIETLIAAGKLDEARKEIKQAAGRNINSRILGKLYFELASAYEKKGELVTARDIYEIILSRYQNIDNILDVQEKLGALNIKILFSPIITDTDVLYEIEPGDTLSKIAKKFNTTVDLLKASNSLKSDVIRAHAKLKVSTEKFKILIDKSQNLLTLLTSDGKIFKVYRVSTGENGTTPVGTFKIINKIIDPVWYVQGAIVPAESPDNILGSRWLGLSEPGYGIHGTIDPDSVGRQVTKGCIRMLNSDVEELYTIVPIGTEVTIVE